MSLNNVLCELREDTGASRLKHTDNVSDRSAPAIEPGTHVQHWDKNALLQEIEGGTALKHVDNPHDRSAPQIEEDVHVQPSSRSALLEEIRAVGGHHAVAEELKAAREAGGPALAHVEAPADRSAPAVEGAHVGQWDKGALLHEIEAPPQLKHVEEVHDRSKPLVEPDVKIKPNPHAELMDEVRATSPKALRHVEGTADRSGPAVSHTAAMRIHGEH